MDPLQLLTTLGAAGALLYVLKLITDGKLHTSSEVQGLKQDKIDLLAINEELNRSLDASEAHLAAALAALAGAVGGKR